jgi:Ca-activated chloride channel family protein
LGDFQFLHPELFYIFTIPLIILVYILTTKKRVEQSFFSKEILEKLTSSNGGLSTKMRTYLSLIALLFMVVALARPVEFDKSVAVKSNSVDVVIALDISKSMLAKDHYPNRLEFAKHKVVKLLDRLGKNRVGVVAFAQNSYTVSPLTFDKKGVSYLVKNLKTNNITQQGTSFKNLLKSVDLFLKDNKDRVLLILSDGGDSLDLSDEVEFAKKSGMKIFVLGIGSKTGSPIQLSNGEYLKDGNGNIVISKFNPIVKDLAFKTGGIFLSGVNSEGDINAILGEMNQIESKSHKEDTLRSYKEYFVFPLLISLVFFFPLFFSFPRLRQLKRVLPFFLLLTLPTESKASILDWWYIDEAEDNFEAKNYEKARENWRKLGSSDNTYFNIGNSYFQEEKFEEAIESYQKVSGDLKQNSLYNIGNSYVKMGKLYEALNSYQKALEFGEKSNIRENLEWVKQQLEKKSENEAKEPPSPENNEKQNDESSEKNQNSENSEEETEESSENGKKQKDKNSENKNSEQEDTIERESEEQKQNGESENSQNQAEENQEQNSTEESAVESQNEQENKDEENSTTERAVTEKDFEQMKEIEEKREEFKILQMLNNRMGGTKIYSIPVDGNSEKVENPW